MTRMALFPLALSLAAVPAAAQDAADPVLDAIWREGMEESRLYPLAQALLDSIGPRLAGTPGQRAAHDWAVAKYREWGIEARNEQYGTWRGWRRGVTHVDLLEPRVRTLEATMLGWSPGTDGPVEGGTVVLPDVSSPEEFRRWLPEARGRWVLTAFAHPTCRPDENWEEWATPESFERMRRERAEAAREWLSSVEASGLNARDLAQALEEAGALGILSSNWQGAWGTVRVFGAHTLRAPMIDLSCEDYGLLHRLTVNGQAPVVRVNAEAEFLGEIPAFNTIGVIPGRLPDEYVLLSAHFDSWDAASGATDNGSGTVTMMEAVRILKEVYPEPRRTILVGHWGGEEQGLNGSRAFAEDNPAIVDGLQVVLNQDNGTGRVTLITMQGFSRAGESFARWISRVPEEISRHIRLEVPGIPSGGGSDHSSFVCRGVPAVQLSALSWDYSTYTWHSNRDTFDKLVFDDLRNNATLTAMLAYLASEDPERVSRERRDDLPVNPQTGQQMTWPACGDPMRSAGESGQW